VKIAVLGAGGVGGYFGGRLAAAGNEVHLLARGDHLAALRDDGLRVRSLKGDFTADVHATDDPSAVGRCDAVLFCVKSYDTREAAARLAPMLGDDTAVVSLQNGVDNEETIAAVVGAGHVLGGAAFIFSTIAAPGVIAHTGGPARIVFGELDGVRTPRVERLLAACQEAGVDAAVPPDIRVVLWSKFAFICAVAGMTAAVRLPLGEIRAEPASWAMFRRLLTEVVAVARAEGVALGPDVVREQVALAEAQGPDVYSSLHHDLVNGNRLELDALHGAVVRRGARRGVPTPANEAVYAILAPWAARHASV
jgi:2-dehydropantoate 2-reductase